MKDKSTTHTLRVFVENDSRPKLNEEVKVNLEYPEFSGKDVVMFVVGRNGIAYHQSNLKLQGNRSIGVKFPVTKAMLPQAKIVFYAFKNNNVYTGSTEIEFDMLTENFLNITIPNSIKSSNNIQKNNIDIDFSTKPNSLVALLAIDKSQTFDQNDHDIKRADVLRALKVNEELYDAAAEINQDQKVYYNKVNRNYVINLEMKNMRTCDLKETDLLDKIAHMEGESRTNDISYYNVEASNPFEFNISNTRYDNIVRKNFLKTWIWTMDIVEDGNGFIESIVPDSMTTWLFTGFSIHPEFGLALAEPQELIVSKKFFIELNLPYSIRIGEVLTLDVIVFNFLSEDASTELKVYSLDDKNAQQFDFMELSDQIDRCSYEKKTGNTYTKSVSAVKKVGTKVEILIQPRINKMMTIRAGIKTTVNGEEYEDYILKTIMVEHEGVEELETNIIVLRPENNTEMENVQFNLNDVNDHSMIEMKAIVAGNIMDNALRKEHIENFESSETAIENMGKFIRNIHIYKYLLESGGFNSKGEQESMANLLKNFYDEMLNFRNPDEGFKLYRGNDEPSSTWLTAHLAIIFGDLKKLNVIDISNLIIEQSLDFCAKKQNADGSFEVTGYEFKPAHPFVETETSKQIRLTCFFTMAFLKHKDLTKSYKIVVDKALDFVRKKPNMDNFAAAVCAYAGIYSEELMGSYFLRQLEMRSYTDGKNRYWDNKKGEKSSDNVRILISSFVAMAYYKNNDFEEVKFIVNFLINHQEEDGGFGDMYTTSVGMEPLALMAEHYKAEKTDMEVKVWTAMDQPKVARVNSNQSRGVTILDLPTNNNFNVNVTGSGYGFAHVTLVFSHTVIYDQISDFFAINVTTSNNSSNSTINLCAQKKVKDETDKTYIKVNLPSGFAFLAEKSDLSLQSNMIKAVETFSGDTVVHIHFDDLKTNVVCFKLYVRKIFTVKKLKRGSAKIYVYNDKKTVSTVFFNLDETCAQ